LGLDAQSDRRSDSPVEQFCHFAGEGRTSFPYAPGRQYPDV